MVSHRDKILDAAQAQMLSKGYSAARVDEICAEAGVTKGSFYHHFESKEALASVLMDRYFDAVTEAFGENEPQGETALERLLSFLDQGVKIAKGPMLRQGCLLGSFALNLSATHPEIREQLNERFAALAKMIEPYLREALRESPAMNGVSAPALARQFISVLEGAIVLAKVADDHGKVAEGVRCYREMLRASLS